jgi:hypothetical protein
MREVNGEVKALDGSRSYLGSALQGAPGVLEDLKLAIGEGGLGGSSSLGRIAGGRHDE